MNLDVDLGPDSRIDLIRLANSVGFGRSTKLETSFTQPNPTNRHESSPRFNRMAQSDESHLQINGGDRRILPPG